MRNWYFFTVYIPCMISCVNYTYLYIRKTNMRFENSELRAFRAVIEEGGFKRAADTLHISQSAVSQAVAGLVHHHEAMAGLLAPTVNSYDRLGPASMAGYWANWAEDHRLVTTRTSTESATSARLEHRMADSSANPYLAVATVLQAAMLGVKAGLSLPKAEDLDGLENIRATRRAPASLTRALDALEKNRLLTDAIGSLLIEAHLVMKRDEVKRLAGRSKEDIRDYYIPFI